MRNQLFAFSTYEHFNAFRTENVFIKKYTATGVGNTQVHHHLKSDAF